MSQAFTPDVREILREVAKGSAAGPAVEKLVAFSFTRETAEYMVRACHMGRSEWFVNHVGWLDPFLTEAETAKQGEAPAWEAPSPPTTQGAARPPGSFNTKNYLSSVPDNYQTLIGYLAKYYPGLLAGITPLQAVKYTTAMHWELTRRCEEKGLAVGAIAAPLGVYMGGIPYLSTFPLSEIDTYVRGVFLSEAECHDETR